MKPYFFGKIQEGKIKVFRSDAFKKHVLNIGEGSEIQLTIEKRQLKRSLNENAYYWAVIVKMVSEEMGVIPDDAHEFMKRLFLKKGIDYKGKRYEITKSTSSLPMDEFEEYATKCRDWAAAELGLVVPLPNEVSE